MEQYISPTSWEAQVKSYREAQVKSYREAQVKSGREAQVKSYREAHCQVKSCREA